MIETMKSAENPDSVNRRSLEIEVARARGWTVEPYVATIETNYGKPHLMGEYDRFRLLDEAGKVRGEWAMTEETAWYMVPSWASLSAERDELERHICERFKSVRVAMLNTGAIVCQIGWLHNNDIGEATVYSFDQKGVAVCRAYLDACNNERQMKKETDAR